MAPFKKPKFKYSEESMNSALLAVKSGMSHTEASKKYEVPRSTLIYKVTGKSPVARKMGPSSVLNQEHEKLLENWIKEMAKRGFPVVKWDLITSVEKIVQEMNIKNPFTHGKPGKKWLSLFMKRHPEISSRVVEKLTSRRAAVKESDLRGWFEEVKAYVNSEGYMEVLENPDRVFNADEAAFMLCPKSEKVLGIKGQKNVYEITGNNEKESITVLITASANGNIAPTMIVFPYVRLPADIARTVPDDWAIGKSDKGWMNSENFYEYITNIFHPWLVSSNITLPVILFLDGHSSHLTLHLSKFCADNGIILLSLYPNATHIIQPLDVAVFRPLKYGWQRTIHEWKLENIHQHLTKYNFAPLLHKSINLYLQKNTLINGFRQCGLCPFNENAVDYSKCIKLIPLESHTIESPKCLSHLQYLESKISLNYLGQFKTTMQGLSPDHWDGDESYKELYHIWKLFKHDDATKDSAEGQKNPEVRVQEQVWDEMNEEQGEPLDIIDISNTYETVASEVVSQPVINIPPGHVTPLKSNICENISRQPTTSSTEKRKRETLSKVISPHTGGSAVPSPFKKILFWPGTPPKKKRTNRGAKLPAAVTSRTWQQYFEKKKKDKEEAEKLKQDRKIARETKKKLKRMPSVSSNSSEDNISLADSDNQTYEEVLQNFRDEEKENCETDVDIPLSEGKYVLVELTTSKNKKRHYVGIIIQKDDDDATVKFLKKVPLKTSTFVWPSPEDVADVPLQNLLKVLPEPVTGRREELIFNISFDGLNIY